MLAARLIVLTALLLGGCARYEASFVVNLGDEPPPPPPGYLVCGVAPVAEYYAEPCPDMIESFEFWIDYVVPALETLSGRPVPRQNPIRVISKRARTVESKMIGEFTLRIEEGDDLTFDIITAEFPGFFRNVMGVRLTGDQALPPDVGMILETRKPNPPARVGPL